LKQGLNILVVDDEPMVRRAIRQMLKHIGHEVEDVESGEAALALLAQRKFDIVMTDFSMPGMQGDELIARIRQSLPLQPIIVATAFAEEYKVFGQPSGRTNALLLKPFSLKDLNEAIEHVLAHDSSPKTDVMPGTENEGSPKESKP
jgi:CheY-like chemotaxis protein